MSKILVTHPGKFGDLLWALPTVRLIAERAGEPVDLMISRYLAPIGPLLKLQPYLANVIVDTWWEVQDTAPLTPHAPEFAQAVLREARARYAKVIHLGYRAWPKSQLAREAYFIASVEGELSPLDLSRPWITPPTAEQAQDKSPESALGEVSVGFTDEWGELKAGVLLSVSQAVRVADHLVEDNVDDWHTLDYELVIPAGGRWEKEFAPGLPENVHGWPGDWVEAAYIISRTQVFLGCLSSLAVLAKALGKPRVLVEPNPHRHHEIFQHPDQGLVLGGDGKPTFDARHVADALQAALRKA